MALDFISVAEVSDGELAGGHIFRRKFQCDPPDVPHHVVAFYKDDANRLVPVTYVHFRPFGDICLVGGACTDGNGLRAIPDSLRAQITSENSCYLAALNWAFARFGPRFDGIFGYCGDARAEAVDLQAGFVKTAHPNLLVFWPKPVHPNIERALIAKAAALGPF